MRNEIIKYLVSSGFNLQTINNVDVLWADILDGLQVLFNISDRKIIAFIDVDTFGEDGYPKYSVTTELKRFMPASLVTKDTARTIVATILHELLGKYIES